MMSHMIFSAHEIVLTESHTHTYTHTYTKQAGSKCLSSSRKKKCLKMFSATGSLKNVLAGRLNETNCSISI